MSMLLAGTNYWRQQMRALYDLSKEEGETFQGFQSAVAETALGMAGLPGGAGNAESFCSALLRAYKEWQGQQAGPCAEYWATWHALKSNTMAG